jgi:hypothetical protein
MSSMEQGTDDAWTPDTSFLTQLVLEVYLAAWTRQARQDERRLPTVAASSDDGDRGDAEDVPDPDLFECPAQFGDLSVQHTTAFRYVEHVLPAVSPIEDEQRCCIAGPANYWKGG